MDVPLSYLSAGVPLSLQMPYGDPKFPIVNPNPSVDDCIKSMRIRDWFLIGGMTAATWVYGYVGGKPVRMPTASTAAAIGLTGAVFLVLQDTSGRLMGYKENAPEVKKYGMHPVQPPKYPPQDPRFPTYRPPVSEATRPALDWKNYQ
jgi:hypothetical protein